MPRVIHFELCADDPERAVQFYQKVFGWEFHKWDGPQDYWFVSTGEKSAPGIDGAIMRRDPGLPGVINTLDVIALDDALAMVTSNGGTVVVPRMAIPGVGYFAYCKDTEGNTFGMMQSDHEAA